ncbi:MAG: beta-ketoacyl synthase chain length factor, partial [Campylobacter sp.]|nr:beta-ketoacyl synthase chain length factor [Campylobacter sp.]
CFTLLKELKDTELISPVSFSLSVLNSAPALVAIEKQNHNEITAISSNLPFENALISAVSKMKDEAFVVVYDELLGDDKEPEDYAFLAMQICRGDKFELEFSSNLMIDNKADKSYLRFLRALKSKAKGYEFSSNSLNFKWTLK